MHRTLVLFLVLFYSLLPLHAQDKRMTRADYIREYHKYATQEMNRSGVPASITLAQGILESDCGNSRLARKANNHFGIKCHKNWDGRKIYEDDDSPGECFRRYESVKESYRDHSDFLKNSSRYASLFQLKPTDYKAWARGLKKAGYATNPSYAELLIKIIEDENLHQFDIAELPKKKKNKGESKVEKPVKEEKPKEEIILPEGEPEFLVDITDRKIFTRNRVDYIIAKEGDTYQKITSDLHLMSWDIAHFNEISKEDPIHPGDVIYLAPKKNKAERGYSVHIVQAGENMHDIAQQYAVKMNKLYKRNHLEPGSAVQPGDRIYLRKSKPLSGTN